MKKTIIIIAIVCILGVIAGGLVSVYLTQPHLQNGTEYSEVAWPKTGMAANIPEISWSNYGDIRVITSDSFHCFVGNSTKSDFVAYVEACEDFGYITNFYNVKDCLYLGVNAYGDMVTVGYIPADSAMVILAQTHS